MNVLVCCLYAFAWLVLFYFHSFLINRSLISSQGLLFVAILLPLLLLLIGFFIPLLIHDERMFADERKMFADERKSSDDSRRFIREKCDNSSLLIRLIHNTIDEEGYYSISEIKFTSEKLGLTKSQINRKIFVFSMSYCRGYFIGWMRLPRFPAYMRMR
jgi:hypothetical protein